MKTVTIKETRSLIERLRALAPNRALSYGESVQLARVQASRLRTWANATDKPDMNLIWLTTQRAIPVNFVPSYKLGGESGLTTDHIGGKLQMFLNDHEPRVRQRFSLLHEFKHVLDFDDAGMLHARLGSGDTKRQANMIEWIANEFAANVLMPTALVKRLWFASQNAGLMASLFNVSVEAMTTRLEILGLLGEPKPLPTIYFRRNSTFIGARLEYPLYPRLAVSVEVDELVSTVA